MNEVLIAHLRECAKLDPSNNTYAEAADAIEELQATIEGYESSTNMVLVEENGKTVIRFEPKWISATERLPLLNTPVLATDGIEVDIAWMYGVPPRWITSFTAIDENKLTHWMPLPKTPREE